MGVQVDDVHAVLGLSAGPGLSGLSCLCFSQRVEVDINVHKPHLNKCLATMANWDTAPLLHLAKP